MAFRTLGLTTYKVIFFYWPYSSDSVKKVLCDIRDNFSFCQQIKLIIEGTADVI